MSFNTTIPLIALILSADNAKKCEGIEVFSDNLRITSLIVKSDWIIISKWAILVKTSGKI